jgi:hypothetical protein
VKRESKEFKASENYESLSIRSDSIRFTPTEDDERSRAVRTVTLGYRRLP